MAKLLIEEMTYNQLAAALMSGQITERRIRQVYARERRLARANIRNIERAAAAGESALGFVNGERPYFPQVANLVTTRDLLAAVADVNRFRRSKTATVGLRRKQVERRIETLQSHGFDVDESNFLQWANFMKWFQASSWAALYDSNDEVVQEAFDSLGNATSSEWNAFFREYTSTTGG